MVNMGRSILDQPSSKSNSLNMPSGSRISARRRYSSILFRASLPAFQAEDISSLYLLRNGACEAALWYTTAFVVIKTEKMGEPKRSYPPRSRDDRWPLREAQRQTTFSHFSSPPSWVLLFNRDSPLEHRIKWTAVEESRKQFNYWRKKAR
ncbi:hypothetical protein Csa_023062 [Cucumis sativus]|nr:hypothetical protein Csa_023062 [Cucumis sativus]